MKKHESHCTLNPDRECGMCRVVGEQQVPMTELLAMMPEPQYKEWEHGTYLMNTDEVNAAIDVLHEATGSCPACILAVLRQKRIRVPETKFDYKAENLRFWQSYNETFDPRYI